MNYPDKIDDLDLEKINEKFKKKQSNIDCEKTKQKWLKTQDPEISLSDNKSSSSTVAETSKYYILVFFL